MGFFDRVRNLVTGHGWTETPAPAPAPQPQPEQRGGLGGLWDRITGADRRREEVERERQLEERERQIEERQRQVEERERQLQEREQAISPPSPAQAPVPEPSAPERDLPKFVSDTAEFISRDERAFGTDSDIGREFESSVSDFIMDRGGLDGLSVDAREWLQAPTISQPFSEYWSSGGFTADQVLEGMTNISNIQITEDDEGNIHIEFDYDSVVDGYEVSGHASA